MLFLYVNMSRCDIMRKLCCDEGYWLRRGLNTNRLSKLTKVWGRIPLLFRHPFDAAGASWLETSFFVAVIAYPVLK